MPHAVRSRLRRILSAGILACVLIGVVTSLAACSIWPIDEKDPPPPNDPDARKAPERPADAEDPTVFFYDPLDDPRQWDLSSASFTPWAFYPSVGAQGAGCLACMGYMHDEESKAWTNLALPAGGPVTLTFNAWWESEAGYDGLVVWVNRAGSADYETLGFLSGSSGGGWVLQSADLTAYAGEQIQLTFALQSDGPGGGTMTDGRGVAVDDITVWIGGEQLPSQSGALSDAEYPATRAKASQVALGMDYEQVIAIMGEPTRSYAGFGNDYYEWVNADGTSFTVTFQNGSVWAVTPLDDLP